MVRDGVPREQALAEMRQWCGTSKKYEGLYGVIAFGALPDVQQSAAFAFDFAPAHEFKGIRSAMVEMSRSFETLEAFAKTNWKPLSDHPDANAPGEAARTVRAFEAATRPEALDAEPADFQAWMRESEASAKSLVEILQRYEQGDAAAAGEATASIAYLKQRCDACHKAYRN